MKTSERREIEQECRDVIVALTHFADRAEARQAAALFALDGVLVSGRRRVQGREQLEAFYAERPPTMVVRHLPTATRVEVRDAGDASSITYYVVYAGEGDAETRPLALGLPFSMGEWHDRFSHTPDGWRIAERTVKRLFQRPAEPKP